MGSNRIAQVYRDFVGRKALLTVLDYPAVTRKVKGKDGDSEEIITQASLGVQIPVTITDARMAYGNTHVLISPLRGRGSTWVLVSDKLQVLDEDEDWPTEEVVDVEASEVDEPK